MRSALEHREPPYLPMDFGSTPTTGIHVSCVTALRDHFGLEKKPVKICEPYQMLGWLDEDLREAMDLDTAPVLPYSTMFGFPLGRWKSWKTQQGLEVLVPGDFNTTVDTNGDILIYPEGDLSAQPSARMPKGGYFFDTIVRQQDLDWDNLDPLDNTEEFKPVSEEELAYLREQAGPAAANQRAMVFTMGGTAFGDIAIVPAPQLKNPKGIRDIEEWYISTATRKDYVREVFTKQCEIGLENLKKVHGALGESIDVVFVCGTDFGTQDSSFCSVDTFRDLYMPFYKQVNNWIHQNTTWKTFKHSCGAVEKFIGPLLESGFDILNPVQCSAAGMDPQTLKDRYGDRIVFWGGGVDTQKTLPFGTPEEVRAEVLSRCEIFGKGGGFVFNTVHNIQARTPIENIVALLDAVKEFRAG